MFEDFENISAKDQAILEADFWQEMAEDLKHADVQKALDMTPKRERYWQDQQAKDFDLHFA